MSLFLSVLFPCRRLILLSTFFLASLIFIVDSYANVPSYLKENGQNSEVLGETQLNSGMEAEAVVSDTLRKLAAKIHALDSLVKAEGRFIERLDQLYQVSYPVAISKTVAGIDYTVVLAGDEITPEGAFVNAYLSFTIPSGRKLAFAANKIPLSAEGGFQGVAELALLFDESVPLSENITLVLHGENKSKVHFDCSGFIDFVIDADLVFSESMLIRENPSTGELLLNQKLTTSFITTIQGWSDLIVEVSLPPFQVAGLKGFGMEVNRAIFDFSDLNNPTGIVFPANYEGLSVIAEQPSLWQGFYISDLIMRMPPEFKEGERLEVRAKDMIIDNMGVSAQFIANNLVSFEEGNLAGWKYSLDKVSIELVANNLTNASIAGKLNLPVMNDTSSVAYRAIIDSKGDFIFSASMPRSFEVPMMVANMTIHETSCVKIEKKDKEFSITAILHGQVDIKAPLKNNEANSASAKGFSVSGLRFQDFTVSTSSPNLKPGIWSVNTMGFETDALGGFALSISKVSSKTSANGDVGLEFTADVSLVSEKYKGSTTLTIWGQNTTGNWKYKDTELKELYVNVKGEVISLTGYIARYDKDPVYGDGFAGKVQASILDLGISATALFGTKDGLRYWYVDAFANLERTPITMSSLAIYGLGGGAYYHMKQVSLQTNVLSMNEESVKKKPVIQYVPDPATSLGFKATVALGTAGSPKAFHAIATFEISFNSSGGLNTVAFYGDGYFMTDMDLQNPNPEAPVYATTQLVYDANAKAFHGNFKVYVNVAGGLIKGSQANNLAGSVVMHYDPVDWYLHIGRPSSRVGLKIGMFGASLNTGSYLMAGTVIEEMPPPPDRVNRLLGRQIPSDRNTTQLVNGGGFAFGTDINFSTGDLTFLIFYSRLDMGVGFDLMLANRSNYLCSNTMEKPGINGWYAEGQVYAFIEGTIGIKVKVMRKQINANIIHVGVAALLQAKLPNPAWVSGAVGGQYSILGGMVKGNCNFEFEVGEQCEMIAGKRQGSAVDGLPVISAVTPEDGRSDVDVFGAPQVVFNYPINKEFSISDEYSTEKFRVVLDYFKVNDSKNQALQGSYVFNAKGDVLVFDPQDILPGKEKIKLEVKIHFEQKINNSWIKVTSEGSELSENKTAEFTTGIAPDYIPESNIVLRYPLPGMMNFYKNEYSKAYIQLSKGQAYLFTEDSGWKHYGRYTPVSGGNVIYSALTYNASGKIVEAIVPASLQNNLIYRFELVSVPAGAAEAIDKNVYSQTTQASAGSGNTMEITEKKATGSVSIQQEKIFYTSEFRTSYFNSFSEKVQATTIGFSNVIPVSNSIYLLQGVAYMNELFDSYELGDDYGEPLIQVAADVKGWWLKERQIPQLYEHYPLISYAIITSRRTSELGLVPIKAVSIAHKNYFPRILSDNERTSGTFDGLSDILTYYSFNVSRTTYGDYYELKMKLINGAERNEKIDNFILKDYNSINLFYLYPLIMNYTLPGGISGSSSNLNIKVF